MKLLCFFSSKTILMFVILVFIFHLSSYSLQQINGSEQGDIQIKNVPSSKITDGSLKNPAYVEVHPDGSVYVLDSYEGRGNSTIKVFDPNGQLVRVFDITDPRDPISPIALAFDKDGKGYLLVRHTSASLFGIEKVLNGTLIELHSSYCSVTSPVVDLINCIDPDGRGPLNLGDGQVYYPRDIEIDFQGDFYIADHGNDRIQKFDKYGNFLKKIRSFCYLPPSNGTCIDPIKLTESRPGPLAKINGTFTHPQSISFGQNGTLFISGERQHGIQEFVDDKFERVFGYFNSSIISQDYLGNFFVADLIQNTIKKVDSNGTVLANWGSNGYGPGQFVKITGIDTDRTGNIYISDEGSDRVQKFSSNGTLLRMWGDTFSKTFWPFDPVQLELNPNKNIVILDVTNNMSLEFDEHGKLLSINTFKNLYNNLVKLDSNGNLFFVDIPNLKLQIPDSKSGKINTINLQGLVNELGNVTGYNPLSDIEFGPQGGLYIASNDESFINGSKIFRVSLNNDSNNYNEPVSNQMSQVYASNNSLSIGSIDDNGNLYVIEHIYKNLTSDYIIRIFTKDNSLVKSFALYYCNEKEVMACRDVTINGLLNSTENHDSAFRSFDFEVDTNGNIYILDKSIDQVSKFTSHGKFVNAWDVRYSLPVTPSGSHDIPNPEIIDIGHNGDIYLLDLDYHHNNRILHYTNDGKFVKSWGSECALYYDGYKSGNPYC